MTENDFQTVVGYICIAIVAVIICLLFYLAIVAQEQIELAQSIWCINAGPEVCDE